MKKFSLLILVATTLVFSGCNTFIPTGIDRGNIKPFVIEEMPEENQSSAFSPDEKEALEAAKKRMEEMTDTKSREDKPSSQEMGSAASQSNPLGLIPKITPKENKGPAENSKAKSSPPAKQNQPAKSGSSDGGNTSALWKEINKLKNRVGNLEDQFDFSTDGKIHGELVFFKSGSTELTKQGMEALDAIAGNATYVLIKGNASKDGSEEKNRVTAKRRAETAQEYLKNKNPGLTVVVKIIGETDQYGDNKNISFAWK